jgi:hypothetical protein
MSVQENWVSLVRAVTTVKAATGSSQGPAQRTLTAICESGDVRARWTGHYLKRRPAIHKREWIGADIDMENSRVIKADGAGMAEVEFSDEDLRHWAKSVSSGANEPDQVDQIGNVSDVSRPAGVQTNKQAALKAKCVDWMNALPGTTPRPAKAVVIKDAMDSIPGLSERQAKAAWDDAAPELWKKPGPKK